MANTDSEINSISAERADLEHKVNAMVASIGKIPIASPAIMPYGWRKAAKGRTVWRIIEEIISQNLESQAHLLGFESIRPADSEVGVYDFEFKYPDGEVAYVNIKSSVYGGRTNKDDISKAIGLKLFYELHPQSNLYVATFILDFNSDMTISIRNCVVMPVSWIPDIYVNPSNNGNLQSAQCKYIEKAIPRTNAKFVELLDLEMQNAARKRNLKLSNLS